MATVVIMPRQGQSVESCILTKWHKQVGDAVKVVSGMFEGYSGILQEINESEKQVTVLAKTGRRDIPIMVDMKDIAKAE